MRHVIQNHIKKDNLERVCELIEKFPWEDDEDFILNEFLTFISIQSKFSDMENIVVLLQLLKQKNTKLKTFVMNLLDALFEQFYRQMERNDFKESQHRVSLIRFLAESYNMKLLHTDTVFDILYRLINYDIETR